MNLTIPRSPHDPTDTYTVPLSWRDRLWLAWALLTVRKNKEVVL